DYYCGVGHSSGYIF
nr:immunoglobulin light chain junction region [Macaca mulatta]MOV99412.1 immunoglobulin light chain junction region [Macaca mulatta]